jgi:pSer/pThr/pTyr-binding forkhead associated (FHA) protein
LHSAPAARSFVATTATRREIVPSWRHILRLHTRDRAQTVAWNLPFFVRRQRVPDPGAPRSRQKGCSVRITVPYAGIVAETGDVTKSSLNDLIRRALDASAAKPTALEIYDATAQRFLLLRERQIYAAAEAAAGQLAPTSIRDFLVGATSMNFPRAAIFELSTKLLHSFLVVAQKKPALRVMTNLVDLDELLDKIEAEGKSCIVAAARDSFLAVLRYEKGKTAAFCHEKSYSAPREGTFREEFLVKVYTCAADKPLTISLYEDFLVSFAPDAKNLPDSFAGRFEDVFLSKPPLVILRFKEREIGRWEMDRPRLRIGRTPDNDIVIDNLAVSRLHSVIEEDRGSYVVRDCDSLNGTEVNHERITRRTLEDGDEITIGKHTIQFRTQSGHAVAEPEIPGFDQTMVFSRSQLAAGGLHGGAGERIADGAVATRSLELARSRTHDPKATSEPQGVGASPVATISSRRRPRLLVHTDSGDRVLEITEVAVTIGSHETADVRVEGLFVGARHAEIVRENERVILRRVGGLRPIRVGGRAVKEVELQDNDEIQLASELIVFHE